MLNRNTYKGRGRPRKSDYLLRQIWQKWGLTLIIIPGITLGTVFWFEGTLRIINYYFEKKAEYQQGIIYTHPKTETIVIQEECAPVEKPEPTPEPKSTIEDLFYQYDWDPELMIAICKAEVGFSYQGWKEDAQYTANTNGSTDTGICMINSVHGYDTEKLKTAEYNVAKAYEVWKRQGYNAWVVYNKGMHLDYLKGTK